MVASTKNRFAAEFAAKLPDYDLAIGWAKGQHQRGWVLLPDQFKRLSKSGSAMLIGNAPDRVVLFDIDEGSDWVRYIGWTERANVHIQTMPAINANYEDAMFTERSIDAHWQISGTLP